MEIVESQFISVPNILLLNGVVTVALKVGPNYTLHQEEVDEIDKQNTKRIEEFSAGRHCARLALAEFGLLDCPIPRGKLGEPIWPQNFVGSISHSETISVATIAKRELIHSIGIDIEPVLGLEESLWKFIEASQDNKPPIENRPLAERLRFCCKEATFKCWFACGGNQLLDFDQISIKFKGPDFIGYGPTPFDKPILGKWVRAADHFWSLAWYA